MVPKVLIFYMWLYIPVCLAVVLTLMALILQSKAQDLIRLLQTDRALYLQAGCPTDSCFFMNFLCFFDYSFILFIIKNKTLPKNIAEKIDNYNSIRKLAIITLLIDFSLIAFIIGLILWTQLTI